MPLRFTIFRGASWTEDDTRRVLEEPIPPDITDFPFEASLGHGRIIRAAGAALATLVPFSLILFDFGLVFTPASIALLTAAGAVALLGLWLQIARSYTSLRIGDDGVRLQGPLDSTTLSWWAIDKVETTPTASAFRFFTDRKQTTIKTADLSRDQHERLLLVIAARIEPRGLRIVLRSRNRFNFASSGDLLGIVGHLFLTGGLVVAGLNTTYALGIRCSVASNYLQTRFGTADHRGCVILRVSGAADRAGIHQGDLMIEMNGMPITSGSQFSTLFTDAKGWHFTFTVLRPGVDQPLHFDVYTAKGGGKSPHTEQTDPLFYYLRARGNAAEGQVDGPIDDYTQAIAMDPAFDLAYLYRADLRTEGPRRDLPVAERDAIAGLQLSPALAEAHRYTAAVYRDEGRRPEAVNEMQQAIQLDQCEAGFTKYNVDCARDYMNLATMIDVPDKSVYAQYEDRAIEFYPGFSSPHYLAAWDYFEAGDVATARERARSYLAFPRSQRNPQADWEMNSFILTPKGTPVSPPPLDNVTPLQFFNEQGTPVPYVTFEP
jgi:hypothetical protein